MGTIKQGILGGFKGKVGSVVGSSWKGIATMKAKPLSVANPKTAKQVNNRNRQSLVLVFTQAIGLDIIRKLWNRGAIKMSGFNAFMSVNKDIYTMGGNFDPSKVVFSKGDLTPLVITNVIASAAGQTVEVDIDNAIIGNQQISDDMYLIVVNPGTGDVLAVKGDVNRQSNSITATNVAGMSLNDTIFCYVACRSNDGLRVSDQTVEMAQVLA